MQHALSSSRRKVLARFIVKPSPEVVLILRKKKKRENWIFLMWFRKSLLITLLNYWFVMFRESAQVKRVRKKSRIDQHQLVLVLITLNAMRKKSILNNTVSCWHLMNIASMVENPRQYKICDASRNSWGDAILG